MSMMKRRFEAEQERGNLCDICCDDVTPNDENEYGEFVCDSCEQNRAEAAYDSYMDRLMEGGGPPSLREQQIQAMKLK